MLIYPGSVGAPLYSFAFPLGVLQAELENLYHSHVQKYVNLKTIVAVLIIIGLLDYFSFYNSILYLVFITFISAVLLPIISNINIPKNVVIWLLGKSSYAIYLCEGIIMELVWFKYGKDVKFINLVCGLSSIIVGVFIHYIWDKTRKCLIQSILHTNK